MNVTRRRRWLPAALLLACTACGPADVGGQGPGRPPSAGGVTLELEPTSDGRCCLVITVNPGTSPTTVLCFVEVFDDTGRLVATRVVPAIPPGHRRSSGFEAPPGRHEHGFQLIPLEGPNDHYQTTCRPAAWHGGAPI